MVLEEFTVLWVVFVVVEVALCAAMMVFRLLWTASNDLAIVGLMPTGCGVLLGDEASMDAGIRLVISSAEAPLRVGKSREVVAVCDVLVK